MFPWEHLAVGYVALSLLLRVSLRRPPRPAEAAAVAVGSQFPDLVDKPLAWAFELLSSGVSLGHSILVAVPLAVLVAYASRRSGRPVVGVAFVVGYLLHIPSDALYGWLFLGGSLEIDVRAFLWPVYVVEASRSAGFVGNFLYYIGQFGERLSDPRYVRYVVVETTLLVVATGLWLEDRTPGTEYVRLSIGRLRTLIRS